MDTWIPGTNLKRSLVQGCFADFARSETGAAGSGSAGAGAAASGAAGARAAGAGADGAAATETGAAGAGDAGTGDAGAGKLLCYFHIRNRFEETLRNKCFKNYGETIIILMFGICFANLQKQNLEFRSSTQPLDTLPCLGKRASH